MVRRLMQYLQRGADGRGLDRDTEAAVVAQLEQFAAAGGEGGFPGDFPGMQDSEDDDDGEATNVMNGGILDFFRGLWQTNSGPPPRDNASETQEGSDGTVSDHNDDGRPVA